MKPTNTHSALRDAIMFYGTCTYNYHHSFSTEVLSKYKGDPLGWKYDVDIKRGAMENALMACMDEIDNTIQKYERKLK